MLEVLSIGRIAFIISIEISSLRILKEIHSKLDSHKRVIKLSIDKEYSEIIRFLHSFNKFISYIKIVSIHSHHLIKRRNLRLRDFKLLKLFHSMKSITSSIKTSFQIIHISFEVESIYFKLFILSSLMRSISIFLNNLSDFIYIFIAIETIDIQNFILIVGMKYYILSFNLGS